MLDDAQSGHASVTDGLAVCGAGRSSPGRRWLLLEQVDRPAFHFLEDAGQILADESDERELASTEDQRDADERRVAGYETIYQVSVAQRPREVNKAGEDDRQAGAEREAQRLSKSSGDGARQAGFYLSAFSKRRQILAAADAKFEYLRDLAPAIKAAGPTILFSQTRKAAERAVKVMKAAGVRGKTLHAGLDPSERRETFDAFRDGINPFIAAPIILDEGVDVPDADLAIVLASSRSRRQMIQRMGRVIRKKADGRLGRVVILYVEGTSEDPQQGAHEDFVQFVLEAADDVQTFDSGRAPTEVVAYLNDW